MRSMVFSIRDDIRAMRQGHLEGRVNGVMNSILNHHLRDPVLFIVGLA